MWGRCLVLAGGQAATGYRQLETFFNQRLAGKFPFSEGLPGRPGDEADPSDVRDFFRLYDAYAPAVLAVPLAPAISEFVTEMGDVRTFFAAFLDDPLRPPAPVFDVEIRFREKPKMEKENGGDRILRWSLASGDRVVTYPKDGVRAVLRWQAGEPLRLELQWAKDSPVVPVESPEQPGVRVEGLTAVVQRSERWSLLALLRGPGVSPAAADPAARLLPLEVSTNSPGESPARVFLGITVRPPQGADKAAKDQPPAVAPNLKVPKFCVVAPHWVAAAAGLRSTAGGRP
jgi:type VI secretion system protein ImpL